MGQANTLWHEKSAREKQGRRTVNHEQLVKHYTELLEAKDRGEQWAIDEYEKP